MTVNGAAGSKTRRRAKAPKNSFAKRDANPESASTQTDPAVAAFLQNLKHRLKPELDAVRRLILGVSPEIREDIKWNSPSFRTTDYFATLNLRAKDGEERIWLILYTGAKVRETGAKRREIGDPAGLLEWLAKDRCLVTFGGRKDLESKRAALQAIIREWIRRL
jgi:hypothetical protein